MVTSSFHTARHEIWSHVAACEHLVIIESMYGRNAMSSRCPNHFAADVVVRSHRLVGVRRRHRSRRTDEQLQGGVVAVGLCVVYIDRRCATSHDVLNAVALNTNEIIRVDVKTHDCAAMALKTGLARPEMTKGASVLKACSDPDAIAESRIHSLSRMPINVPLLSATHSLANHTPSNYNLFPNL